MRSPVAIAVAVAVAALLGLLVYGVAAKQGGNKYDEAVAAGRRLPAQARLSRVLGSDRKLSVASFRGKVVLLNFWASWCEPCRQESPALERAYRRYAARGLVVLGADVDDLSSQANAFIKEFGLTYPIIRYTRADATRDFGTRQMPESFLIDRRGRVVALRRYEVDDKWLDSALPPVVAERR